MIQSKHHAVILTSAAVAAIAGLVIWLAPSRRIPPEGHLPRPQHIEEVRVAGMSSTLLALGQRAATELGRGALEQVLIRGAGGYVVMVKAKSGTMLMALTTKVAKLGLIFLDMNRAVDEIDRIL